MKGDNGMHSRYFITGPPNGPVLFCALSSVGVVCNAARRVGTLPAVGPAAGRVDCQRAGDRVRGRSDGRHCTAGQYGYVPLGRNLVIQVSDSKQILICTVVRILKKNICLRQVVKSGKLL